MPSFPSSSWHRKAQWLLIAELLVYFAGLASAFAFDQPPAWAVYVIFWPWLVVLVMLPFTVGAVAAKSIKDALLQLSLAAVLFILSRVACALSWATANPRFAGAFGGLTVWSVVASLVVGLPALAITVINLVRGAPWSSSSHAGSGRAP